jgi:predicted DsbA family dithiol-disulfide isomerase
MSPRSATLGGEVRVEIWSDVVCPWCYVGHRRFAEAVERTGGDVEVTYRAFELDPTVPPGGEPLDAYLARKFGGPGAVAAVHTRLARVGADSGVELRWEGKRRANTFDAHRLSAWSLAVAGPDGQARVIDRLFFAYFTDNADIADHGVLADLADQAGLDADGAATALASGAFGDEVRADEQAASERDIHAVPSFVVEDRWLVPGAQDVDTFVRMLDRAAERLSADDR